MNPEFWIGLICGALGVGLLWSGFEAWRSNARVQAWLASEQQRIERETEFTWPPKACPCGSIQKFECQENDCEWTRDPSLVPLELRQQGDKK